jgi:AbiV family abortive infection protein
LGKALTYFKGALSAQKIAEGINAARRNAVRLADDAKLLLEAGRYPTAAAMAVLSIEEAGKVPILRALPFARSLEEIEEVWRDYRNHRAKNGAWVILDWARGRGHKVIDFARIIDKEAKHTEVLEAIKQISLYTDCYNMGVWSEPATSIDVELADRLVHAADILAHAKPVTVREIELWIEHLELAWNTQDMPRALIRWAQAMEGEGLGGLPAAEFEKLMLNQQDLVQMLRARMKD